MAEFPTGSVTFLFTDLERSTALWEQHPDAMRAALTRHDEILRSAVESYGGTPVKTTGDGLIAVFATASDAVTAAVAAQTELMSEAWPLPEVLRARMGLHTGHAELRDGDYHGPTVNRAARVAGVAHPGQILVSSATASLLEGSALRDLGEQRLRGLPAMRLHQVMAPGLADDYPPLATAPQAVDLPSPPTMFVGRDAEVGVVGQLIGEHRLVTLAGAGGAGKTRLAIAAAERLADRFPDGVRFADLAAVTDEARVADVVVHALGLADDPTAADPLARLSAYMTDRALLCVVDNCEHVLDACARVVEAIVSCPGPSRLLATSRESLGVFGEQVFVVPSLDTDTDAVRLFADRAAEARADFVVDETNRAVVAEICRRLDGIPLAIELAAPRIAHLSPPQILERLDDRFRLLTGGPRRVPRHQTLGATLDWSHDLLDREGQKVLRRLAVFPASFTLEAAEAVVEADDIVEAMGSLVSRSLVQVLDDGDRLRYRLLESIRLYADAHLAAAGEVHRSRARHRDWVVDWLESIPLEQRWFGDADLLAAEHPSIRAALEWSAAEGDADTFARIATGVDWARGEYWREGLAWSRDAAAADGLAPGLRLQALVMHLRLSGLEVRGPGDHSEGKRQAERAIAVARGEPSPLHAYALTSRAVAAAVLAARSGDDSLASGAAEWAEAGVEMSEQFGAPWQMFCRLLAGNAYATLAFVSLGDVELAEAHYAVAIDAAPPASSYRGLRALLSAHLALHRVVAGDTTGALVLARDALVDNALSWVLRQGDPMVLALAVVLGASTDFEAARRQLRDYDLTARRADFVLGADMVVVYGGVLAAQRGDWETAAKLLAAGDRSIYRSPATALLYFTFRDRARAALGSRRSRQLRDEGRAMPLAEAHEAALH
jgi:predicted ATPase/class 3 adenylate cyclase